MQRCRTQAFTAWLKTPRPKLGFFPRDECRERNGNGRDVGHEAGAADEVTDGGCGYVWWQWHGVEA